MHRALGATALSVIGQLLAAPPAKGALRAALQQLAAREWRHPTTGAPIRFGVSTWNDGSTVPATSSMTRSACCAASSVRMPASQHR